MTFAEREQIAAATEACATLTREMAAVLTRLIEAEARLAQLEEAATSPTKKGAARG